MSVIFRLFVSLFALYLLSACSNSDGVLFADNGDGQPGGNNATPTSSDAGTGPIVRAEPDPDCQSRVGEIYDVVIPSPVGADINATVFEPTNFDCNSRYPLVLFASGFGGFRQTSLAPASDPQSIAFTAIISPQRLLANGYGVLTFDHTGHNGAPGFIRVMDPDYEGQNVITLVDWAEENLPWLAYGESADGTDPDNLILGAVGASYGGGFQHMLLGTDPRKRLDAIVPQLTWHDLPDALAPGGAIKDGWVSGLADGQTTFDPYLEDQLIRIFEENRVNQEIRDILGYHSISYFCNGLPIATNGGAGTSPGYAPVAPPQVNALYVQSSRDILFDLNDAWNNYQCLKAQGGDVRLFTMQAGHNTLGTTGTVGLSGLPDDPGAVYQPDPAAVNIQCGTVPVADAQIAFFDEHLKGIEGASDAFLDRENPLCLSLSAGDAIHQADLLIGGDEFPITENNIVTVGQDDSQTETTVLLTQVLEGAVLAGIPQLSVTLSDADNPGFTDPDDNTIIFAAIGHRRAVGPGMGVWDIVDNQIQPLRGLGTFDIDLVGVLERLRPGDEIGLMLMGSNENQFERTGVRPEFPFVNRVKVEGVVRVPLLGNLPPVP